MSLFEIQHAVTRHHLSWLRSTATDPAEFRRLIHRLAGCLAYEATRDLRSATVEVHTPLTTMTGSQLADRIALVPIMRAGLGMVEPVLEFIPDAVVWHLGIYRDEQTATPVEYYCRIPDTAPVDVALILDPMLATGGSARAAISVLKARGIRQVKILSVIAAQPGIQALQAEHPDVAIITCAVDPELNSHSFIVPGLGDAGDRQFKT